MREGHVREGDEVQNVPMGSFDEPEKAAHAVAKCDMI